MSVLSIVQPGGVSVAAPTICTDAPPAVVTYCDGLTVTLAMSHDVDTESDRRAANRLSAILRDRPALVVQRFDFHLPAVDAILERCQVLESAPEARLLRCAAPRGF